MLRSPLRRYVYYGVPSVNEVVFNGRRPVGIVYVGVPQTDEVIYYGRRPREVIVEGQNPFSPQGDAVVTGSRPREVVIEEDNPFSLQEEVIVTGRRPREIIFTGNNVYSYLPFLYLIQPQPNYALDETIVNQITYKILTDIVQYKPRREVEIAPVSRLRINLV